MNRMQALSTAILITLAVGVHMEITRAQNVISANVADIWITHQDAGIDEWFNSSSNLAGENQ